MVFAGLRNSQEQVWEEITSQLPKEWTNALEVPENYLLQRRLMNGKATEETLKRKEICVYGRRDDNTITKNIQLFTRTINMVSKIIFKQFIIYNINYNIKI